MDEVFYRRAMFVSLQNISPQNTILITNGKTVDFMESPDRHQLFQVTRVNITSGGTG